MYEPTFESNGIPCYMGVYRTYLHPGAFVIVGGENSNPRPSCHRIVKIIDSERIVVQAFIPLSDTNIRQFAITEPHAKYIPEVCRSMSTLTIHPQLIVDIAFVFKADQVLDGSVRNLQGMTNAFILRFDESGTKIPDTECLPFSCSYPEHAILFNTSFACHIWETLTIIHEEMERLLGRSAKSQGVHTKAMVKIGCDKSAWLYLTMKAKEADCCVMGREVNVSLPHRWTLPGLSVLKIREKRVGELLRFETKKDLECLCGIFGETTTVNVRAIAPATPKEGPQRIRELQVGDLINIIEGSEEREDPFKRRTQCDSVDFVFDGIQSIRCYLRYTRTIYEEDAVINDICSSVIGRKRPLSLSPADVNDTAEVDPDVLMVDSDFELDGRLYNITAVTDNSVTARSFYPTVDLENILFNNVLDIRERVLARMNES